MKRIPTLLWSAALLAVSFTHATSAPLVRLTVRSYSDLKNAINQVAQAAKPDSQTDFGQSFGHLLGIEDPATLDAERPWQFTVWYEGDAFPPLFALKVPVQDMAAFKEGLNPQGMLRKQGQEWTQLDSGIGVIALGKASSLGEPAQQAFAQWKNSAIPKSDSMIHLDLSLSEPVRRQVLEAIGKMKTTLTESFITNQALAAMGGNPKAMGEFFTAYFGMIETSVKGLKLLSLGFDVNAEALTVKKVATANPDTELAQWFHKQAGRISEKELRLIDPEATFSLAAHFGNEPIKMAFLKKIMVLSFQMQNNDPQDPMVKELEGMFETLFPMNFAGSVNFGDQLTFAGAYGFPEAKVNQIYSRMKGLFNEGLQSMVGPDKIYATAELKEKHHEMAGTPIDRFSLTLNTNSPLFSLPGQKEQLLSFWPDGKLDLDYAVKGNQLLFASPDRMPQLLRGQTLPNTPWNDSMDETTVLVGYMNVLSQIKRTVATNPMVPLTLREKLSQMDSQGTSFEFQVKIDGQLRAQMKVPMKLFREMGRLNR